MAWKMQSYPMGNCLRVKSRNVGELKVERRRGKDVGPFAG
jgi:hypothetical protein